ncbi:MAG: SIR2 family protein [Verrucomicrobia bacterium]|nr:SIR2 family protein [Verrucomicrobiota bacterium]
MTLGSTPHDLQAQLRAIQLCLIADKRPLGFFLGAGCPQAIRIGQPGATQPLIPDLNALTARVHDELNAKAEHKSVLVALVALCGEDAHTHPTVEDYLNRLRNVRAVGGTGPVRGITPAQATLTDKAICRIIAAEVGKTLPDQTSPYHALARWIRGIPRDAAVEIFTPNYDLLFEQSLEECGVPYFDGFVGTRRAFMDIEAMDKDKLPARWARLWKLHGSINWHRTEDGNFWRGADSGDGELLIYPSHHKYTQSRRMPFLAMQDRLRTFLARPEAVLVICGYSFVDEHFNALIREGLRGNGRVVVFGLVYGNITSEHPAIPLAEEAPNFLLMGRDGAVIGGNRGNWPASASPSGGSVFELGDFAKLGTFLSSVSGQALI